MDAKIAQKGPYVAQEKPGKKFWCACGFSQNQPYCDGSHAKSGTGLTPVMVEFTEEKKVAWCGCKHSDKKPYCDGSHSKI